MKVCKIGCLPTIVTLTVRHALYSLRRARHLYLCGMAQRLCHELRLAFQ